MEITQLFEILGTIAFAIAGAFAAMQSRLDLFGLLCAAVVTATGGGMCRDIILGNTPPLMFREPTYVALAAAAGMLTALLGEKLRKSTHLHTLKSLLALCDALGLSVFTIVGMRTAIKLGYGDNAFLCCFVGVVSAVGGGLLRDIMLAHRPALLQKEIYATAAAIGAVSYFFLRGLLPDTYAAFIAMAVILLVRLLALRFNLNLPRAGERFE